VTTPAPGGGPSPLRLGGLALIGVAVIAAVIGLSSMATGSDPAPTAAPSPAAPSTTPPPGTVPADAVQPPALPPGEPLPTSDGTVPVPSLGEPVPGDTPPGAVPPGEPAPASGAPGAPAPAPPGDGGEPMAAPPPPASSGGDTSGVRTGDARGERGTSAVRAPLRVYNNSTISGLAARAAEDFRRAGWSIDEVGNYPHGIIPTTTVYFRPGTGEEEPALALGEQFGMRVNPRFEGLQNATPGIIVIVTNDYGR
jgi:LytR cell envelope-related transcriptional attenuator